MCLSNCLQGSLSCSITWQLYECWNDMKMYFDIYLTEFKMQTIKNDAGRDGKRKNTHLFVSLSPSFPQPSLLSIRSSSASSSSRSAVFPSLPSPSSASLVPSRPLSFVSPPPSIAAAECWCKTLERSREGTELRLVSDVLLLSEMDRKDCSALSTFVNVLGRGNDTGDARPMNSGCLDRLELLELAGTSLSRTLHWQFGEIQAQWLDVTPAFHHDEMISEVVVSCAV